MKRIARRWRTVLLAAPVAAALGFGASQAFAAPGAAADGRNSCPTQPQCNTECPNAGGYLPEPGSLFCACCPW